MRKGNKKLASALSLAITFILTISIALTGCAKDPKDALVGEYSGTSNSYLKLNADGTCIYSEPDSTGSGTGTWTLEDNILNVDVDNLKYTVHADISEDPDGFILTSDSGSWNDEYFKKAE